MRDVGNVLLLQASKAHAAVSRQVHTVLFPETPNINETGVNIFVVDSRRVVRFFFSPRLS